MGGKLDQFRPGSPLAPIAVLMLSVFTVSLGYGIALPLLPALVERQIGTGAGSAAAIARSTGFLAGLYTFSLFLFAPMWGRLSDRHGRRTILLIGLVGFGAISLSFAPVESLWAVYTARFFGGLFAAAVTPVALAAIGDMSATEELRGRRLALVSLAGIIGFMLGPLLGVFIANAASIFTRSFAGAATIAVPQAAAGLLAMVAASAGFIAFPRTLIEASQRSGLQLAQPIDRSLIRTLLSLSLIVSAGIAVFHIGLVLRGEQQFGLTSYQTALMFTACTVTMLIAQTAAFSPLVKPNATRWIIFPGLVVLAVALYMVPRVTDLGLMFMVIVAVAASAGILSPILTYWISVQAGGAQGALLGRQTAAASLGAAAGSAAGGLLFGVTSIANAAFVLISIVTVAAACVGWGLPKRLAKAAKLVENGSIQR